MSPSELGARLAALVKVALVGTDRQPLPAGGPLERLHREGDPEGSLLAEAAALALAERAARLPPRADTAAPTPAPEEKRPRCKPGAVRLLVGFLVDGEHELIAEWLALAARAGVRADETTLPELLDHGRSRVELRAAIAAVLGERGPWLAREIGDAGWSWAIAAPAPDAWATGTRAERLALLAATRGADPARGRELVESTFDEDAVEERAAFVAALALGLSDADEPFLEERARVDRRKEVRTAAATLLARLPGSRFAARMAERARAHVHLDAGEIKPPHAFDPDFAADGIEASAPRGEGARAFWLRQIVAAAPLAMWGAPAEALAAARRTDWAELLIGAWAVASARQRDAAWAEAILGVTLDLPDLLAVLPPERGEALVDRALRAGADADLIAHLRHPWSEPFSRSVLRAVRGPGLHLAAPRLHPTVVAELVAQGEPDATLERRASMHKELSS